MNEVKLLTRWLECRISAFLIKLKKSSWITLVLLLLTPLLLVAQSDNKEGIQTALNYTPTQLIKDIFIGGDCFEVQNIRYSGSPSALGFFNQGENAIDIEKGVILSTGNISNAHGPNISTRISTDFEEFYPIDSDLEALLDNQNVTLEDVVVLEFDFTPTTNLLQFQYAFASEEYCDYVGSKFNDVFGFFLSGPGIDGPFENGAENIAFVPGTSDFVAINNINHLSNSAYFVNNIPAGQVQFVPCKDFPEKEGVATDLIEFDGFTTVLTALAQVQACETYHIKLAIADVSDALFDSAVFLKGNSFNAGGVAYVTPQIPAVGMIEGCQESYLLFERTDDDLIQDLKIQYKISDESTALEGTDFHNLPDTITIPSGERYFRLPIRVLEDDLVEGQEHLIMELESACSCADLSISLPISDYVPLTAARQTTSICGEQEITITSNIEGGVGQLKYRWNTGDTTSQLRVFADTSSTFSVTVTDACQRQVSNDRLIEVLEAPEVTLARDTFICELIEPIFFDVALSGTGPWRVDYSFNGVPQSTIFTDEPNYAIPAYQEGLYQVQKVSNDNCSKEVNVAARLFVSKPESTVPAVVQPVCKGELGRIHLQDVRGGQMPYRYSIDGGTTYAEHPIFESLTAGEYELVVQDKNKCEWRSVQTINQPSEINISVNEATEVTIGETVDLEAFIDLSPTDVVDITWTPAEWVDCFDCLQTTAQPLEDVNFEIQVTDKFGCIESAEVAVSVLKDYQLFIPTAFSPNGDGQNDLFFIHAKANQIKEITRFQVINRWGDLIYEAQHFQPNDPSYGWDGTFNGQMLTNQVLAYFLEITFIDGTAEVVKGDVTLVSK